MRTYRVSDGMELIADKEKWGGNLAVIRSHQSMESMHWGLDSNFLQDKIKRKSMKAAGNLNTLQ